MFTVKSSTCVNSSFCWIVISPDTLETVCHFIANIYLTSSFDKLKIYCSFIMSTIGYYNTHKSMTCLCSLWATSCIIGFSNSVVLQNNKQWFVCSVRSSRALTQTHRVILMRCVCMKYQNHSTGIPHFPVLTPTFFALFCVHVRTTSLCAQLPHTDIVVITTSREFAPILYASYKKN